MSKSENDGRRSIDGDEIAAKLRSIMGDLLVGAERLGELARTVDYGDLPDANEVRVAASAIKATALHALAIAAHVAAAAERLSAVAKTLESAASSEGGTIGS